ncbi:phosphorelay protein LuxU [Vibrio galatheae]|uniref:Phosphorelay protein LuxU n=1 Tax=Vibrio galatheae TaxID=579748 RepID=A0A0F4NPT3_9VIBR|nr:quorum-sensing phosphorelay protein LuxU [Vibrio galatheae]KJY85155.1 phosphorelay protein LuxU [Vibrio galatheae]
MELLDQSKIDRLAEEIGAENVPLLLEIFLGELQTYITKLSQLEGQEQALYLKEISHALKSSAASFGAEALRAHSADVDSSAKSGGMLDSTDHKQQMLSLLSDTQQRYQGLYDQ